MFGFEEADMRYVAEVAEEVVDDLGVHLVAAEVADEELLRFGLVKNQADLKVVEGAGKLELFRLGLLDAGSIILLVLIVEEVIDFVVAVSVLMDWVGLIPHDLSVDFGLALLLHFLHGLDVPMEEFILASVIDLDRIGHLRVELRILFVLVIEEFHERLLHFLVFASKSTCLKKELQSFFVLQLSFMLVLEDVLEREFTELERAELLRQRRSTLFGK